MRSSGPNVISEYETFSSERMPLTPNWYTDPTIFALEHERLFRHSWQWVGRLDQVAEPGSFFTTEVAGEPIIVARHVEGQLVALSNVCRHRGGRIVRGAGKRRSFSCTYHGWTYDLDGILRRVPFAPLPEKIIIGETRLPRFQVESWGPFIFVNCDANAPSLADSLGEVPEAVRRYRLGDLRFVHEVEFSMECNWKVYAENSRECIHCASVHPSFRYAYEVERPIFELIGSASRMTIRERERNTRSARSSPGRIAIAARALDQVRRESPARRGLSKEESQSISFVYMFPNFILTLAPDHLSASRTIALAPDRTLFVRNFFIEDGDKNGGSNWDDANIELRVQTTKEDIAICEEVQRSMLSKTFTPAPYSPHEVAIAQFHEAVRLWLTDS